MVLISMAWYKELHSFYGLVAAIMKNYVGMKQNYELPKPVIDIPISMEIPNHCINALVGMQIKCIMKPLGKQKMIIGIMHLLRMQNWFLLVQKD